MPVKTEIVVFGDKNHIVWHMVTGFSELTAAFFMV